MLWRLDVEGTINVVLDVMLVAPPVPDSTEPSPTWGICKTNNQKLKQIIKLKAHYHIEGNIMLLLTGDALMK